MGRKERFIMEWEYCIGWLSLAIRSLSSCYLCIWCLMLAQLTLSWVKSIKRLASLFACYFSFDAFAQSKLYPLAVLHMDVWHLYVGGRDSLVCRGKVLNRQIFSLDELIFKSCWDESRYWCFYFSRQFKMRMAFIWVFWKPFVKVKARNSEQTE